MLGDWTRELVGVRTACGDCVRGDVGLFSDALAASELVRGERPLTASDEVEAPGFSRFSRFDELGIGRGCATAWFATACSGTDDGIEMPPGPLAGYSSAVW